VNLLGKGVFMEKKSKNARFWWLTPIIPTTWEAEIRRISGQPGG
jgi:hypothetical protein